MGKAKRAAVEAGKASHCGGVSTGGLEHSLEGGLTSLGLCFIRIRVIRPIS